MDVGVTSISWVIVWIDSLHSIYQCLLAYHLQVVEISASWQFGGALNSSKEHREVSKNPKILSHDHEVKVYVSKTRKKPDKFDLQGRKATNELWTDESK